MEEDTEVLDWDNGDDYNVPEPQHNYTAQDDDDRVSLGGDDEDEDEYFDSRKAEPNTEEPPPSVESSSQLGSQQPEVPPETKPPHAEISQSSQTRAQTSPKSPVAEVHKINPPLVHALPPKPVSAMMVKRRDVPSSTAAQAMRSPNVKDLPLPPDWEVRKSRSGAGSYYYNIRTFETSWIRPTHDARPSHAPDFKSSDSRGSGERNGLASRNRRPPSDVQPSEGMSYEDRHYRPGERADEAKEPNVPNRSRTPPNQWSREDSRRYSSRRTSSLERDSNSRHQARDSRDRDLGRGQLSSRDEPTRSKSTRDLPPSRNEQSRASDSYVPSNPEPKSRGRTDGPQMRSGPPTTQHTSKPRPRSPDPYPSVQTRPAETGDRKREGKSSRFSQVAPPSQNASAQIPAVLTSVPPVNDYDPYVPDDLITPSTKADKDDQEASPAQGGRSSTEIVTHSVDPSATPSDRRNQSLYEVTQPKRPPLPPQAQSFHKAKQGSRQRFSRSVSPRPNTKRNEQRAISPSAPVSPDYGEPRSAVDERFVDPNLQAPRGPRSMMEHKMVDRDWSTLPPPTAPSGPAAYGERKRRTREDSQAGAPIRNQGKFHTQAPAPTRMSGSNNTPIPAIRRYGSGQVPPMPRSEYPPPAPQSFDELPMRPHDNRHPDLSLPPPPPPVGHFEDGSRQRGPRGRRGSLNERYPERRPPSVPTSISAGPVLRDSGAHPPFAYEREQARLSPSHERPHRPPPPSYDGRYENERGRFDPDERSYSDREPRADYREDRYRRPDQQQSFDQDRYDVARPRDSDNGSRYPSSEQDRRWGAQSQESSNRLPIHPSRAKFIATSELSRPQDTERLPPREWVGRDPEPDMSSMNVVEMAPRTSLLERMTEQRGNQPSLQDRVHVPTKREREGGRPNDEEETAKRRRRSGRRAGGRRNQAIPATT